MRFSERIHTDKPYESYTCDDLLSISIKKTDFFLLGLRYVLADGNGYSDSIKNCSHKDVLSNCYDAGPKGLIVRTFCSFTCGCDRLNKMLAVKHGCSNACLSNLFLELSYKQEAANVSLSDCEDHDEFFKDPSNSKQLTEYFRNLETHFKLPQNTVPVKFFQRYGCQALKAMQKKNKQGAVHKDALCGVAHKTSVALRNLRYASLRPFCPVSCACTLDFSDECPRSCNEDDRKSVDLCSKGICTKEYERVQAGTFVKYDDGSYPCEYIDWEMRRRADKTQQDCEQHVAEYSKTCCTKTKSLPTCNSTTSAPANLLPIYKMQGKKGGIFEGPATCSNWSQYLCDDDHAELFKEYCPNAYCSECESGPD